MCRLFGSGSSKLKTEGYTYWNNVNSVISYHERSAEHTKNLFTSSIRSKNIGKIDSGLLTQMEVDYWRSVTKRVVTAVKKPGSCGLAFWGKMKRSIK